jgi:HK97 family phage prohead protease
MSEPFALSFGIKAVQETVHDGQRGLLLQGYATRFGEVDQSGEHMTRGALADLADCWGAEPIVLFEHGLSELGTRRIGKAIDHKIDDQGLHVSVFVPQQPAWTDERARSTFSEVYSALKRGVLRGFSVGGTYTRDAAGAIKRWSMLELSVVSKPCLPSATFAVGAKALADAYGSVPAILDDDSSDKGGSVNGSQTHSVSPGTSMHLALPPEHVTVSAPVGAAAGGWTLSFGSGTTPAAVFEADRGTKAAQKKEPDGAMHPPSHYLVVEDPDKASTFHLQVKNASGDYDRTLCAQAYAALTSNFRGNPYSGPDKQAALKKLRAIYKSQGWDWPADEESSSGSGKKADVTRGHAVAVLREFTRQTKAGRTHSAATVAAVRTIADGLQGHVDQLRGHFGLDDQGEDEDEQDESAPLVL